jgi:uncharacterized protein (TIGR00369 family)
MEEVHESDATAQLDAETEATRLESIEQYLAYLRESNPYYSWLDPEVLAVERGLVRIAQDPGERTKPPEIGPAEGINGGILMTLADAAGMAAIVAEALEPIPLATTQMNMSFHDGATETHVVEAEVVDFGSTLATSRIEVFPESDLDEADRTVLVSGEATARLFD